MNHSYDVRIWKLQTRKNASGKVTSYRVRWEVAGREFPKSFKLFAQADSFRSELLTAQRRGEAFDCATGLPVSKARPTEDVGFHELSRRYVDMRWPTSAATARQTTAEALMRVAPVFLPAGPAAPKPEVIRSALRQYGYNTAARKAGEDVPDGVRKVLNWCDRHSAPVRVAQDPDTLRKLQTAVTRRLDGKPFAPSVARKTRAVLWNFLDYAVEENAITANPLAGVKWTAMPKGKRKVDKRAVPNPIQARTLLNAVRETKRSGPRLEAFFGVMYFAALRPEEAAALNKRNLSLPAPTWNEAKGQYEYGFGELHLNDAAPHVGGIWTDGGTPRDERHLKSRDVGEGRTVPCVPELTEMLVKHMANYPPAPNGRIFTGERGDEIPMITYTRAWRAARRLALTEEAQRSPLAARPYDLRHAAVSTWLSGEIEPPRVAEWAGHSVSVLYEVYAAFLDGGDHLARRQMQAALGYST